NDEAQLGITPEALVAIVRTIGGRALRFSTSAVKGVRDANRTVDVSSTFFGVAEHFDDDSFGGATTRLQNLKASVIAKITALHPDGAGAREDLGAALHTVQDFYAHSNWVELGNTSIESALGRTTLAPPPVGTSTCPTGPGILGGVGLARATTGYFPFPNPCVLGWFGTPAGRCRHGVNFFCGEGLNKDDPTRPGYASARALAVEATADFVGQVLDAPGVAGNLGATAALMGIGSLGVVVDTTGSMEGVLDQVKDRVRQTVRALRDAGEEPSQYLLVAFNDPEVGHPLVTTDADEFLAALDSLVPGDGGDCPELSMTGLVRAVAAADPDSVLYLVTDASAKDAALAANVVALAGAKKIRVTALLFGSCSPIDPAYLRVADETGGRVFLEGAPGAAAAAGLVRPRLEGADPPI